MLEIKNVSKKYGRQEALKNVNLAIPQGEIIGLFGENGAGKTTLMKCILGFLPYQGEITLDGKKISHEMIITEARWLVTDGLLSLLLNIFGISQYKKC